MGSQGIDESAAEGAGRQDKHRVEQSRIPAPPSGYSRVDSLDDLDDPPTQRRSHRWNRKPSISGQTPVTVDDAADSADSGGVEEHPPLPVAALIDDPLPDTVPTEAVTGGAGVTPVTVANTTAYAAPEASEVPMRTGEPYEEHGEALRSRRITELEDDVARLTQLSRRGTLDLGLLVLRVAVGAHLALEGARRLFGWLGGPSLNGFETTLLNTPNRALGFDEHSAGVVAVGWSVTQLVVGIVLIAGFLTPIVGALGLAVTSLDLAYGVTLAGGVQMFADQRGSVAFPAALAVLLITVLLCGPGRYSLDGNRAWARRPGFGSVAMILVGVGVAVLIWMMFNGTNPLSSPGNPG